METINVCTQFGDNLNPVQDLHPFSFSGPQAQGSRFVYQASYSESWEGTKWQQWQYASLTHRILHADSTPTTDMHTTAVVSHNHSLGHGLYLAFLLSI